MEQGLRDTTAARNARDPLAVAYQNAWEKLRKYYELTVSMLLQSFYIPLIASNTLTITGQVTNSNGKTS
jgi:hypothetical protein